MIKTKNLSLSDRLDVCINGIDDWGFRIPGLTLQAQTPEITRDKHKGMCRVHVFTPDFFELYFEVVSLPGRLDHSSLIEKQKPFIEENFTSVEFEATAECEFRGLSATEFAFISEEKARKFLYFNSVSRSYRIILNPLSRLNYRVLESFNTD